jgi:hypothetical protein
MKFPPDQSIRLSGPKFVIIFAIGKICAKKSLFPALFWHRLSRLSTWTASESQIEAPIQLPGRGPDR